MFSSLKPIESDRISRLISDKVARVVIVTVTIARILDIREDRGVMIHLLKITLKSG